MFNIKHTHTHHKNTRTSGKKILPDNIPDFVQAWGNLAVLYYLALL